MRILIVPDAWHPQINGVVRTLTAMRDQLTEMGDDVYMLTPQQFRSVPCPTYPEIRLALAGPKAVAKVVAELLPRAIHIATEGPLGLAARRFCVKSGLPFTTAFHTRFPEYIEARTRIPADWIYPLIRWFHSRAERVMVPTPTVVRTLEAHGFQNVRLWGRGVDVELFKPGPKPDIPGDGPVLLYVGRIAVEKNIAAFLDLEAEGRKVVVGDGPMIGSPSPMKSSTEPSSSTNASGDSARWLSTASPGGGSPPSVACSCAHEHANRTNGLRAWLS